MARPDALETAKRELLRALESQPWLVSLGTGRVDGALGLIVSVDKGARAAALEVLGESAIAVPVKVREVGRLRIRPRRPRADSVDLAALRREAARRSGRSARALGGPRMPAPDAIDVQRHPLDRLDEAPGRELVERCRAALARDGLAQLPGFLRPEAVASCAREALRCGEGAYHMDDEGMPYLPDESTLAPDDPRLYRVRTALRFVPGDEVPSGSLLWTLYEWPPMLDFVRRALGREALYRASDALNSVNYLVYADGDEQDWHFDEHDFSVTILLQASASACFEFVPHLRHDGGEDLEGMRRAQTGTHPGLVRPPASPGTLSLFEGRYHYHRATRVQGERERLLALLQYGDRPDDPDDPSARELNRLFYGRPD